MSNVTEATGGKTREDFIEEVKQMDLEAGTNMSAATIELVADRCVKGQEIGDKIAALLLSLAVTEMEAVGALAGVVGAIVAAMPAEEAVKSGMALVLTIQHAVETAATRTEPTLN